MDPQNLIPLVERHDWRALWITVAGLAIGAIIRALKSPKVPAPLSKIPPKWRPVLALVLGSLAEAPIDRILQGTPWREALYGGLAAAAVAVFVHQLGIEGARDGREIGVPKPSPQPERERETAPPTVSHAEATPITLRGGDLPPPPLDEDHDPRGVSP